MAVPFAGLGSPEWRARATVSWGQVELGTQIGPIPPLYLTLGRLSRDRDSVEGR